MTSNACVAKFKALFVVSAVFCRHINSALTTEVEVTAGDLNVSIMKMVNNSAIDTEKLYDKTEKIVFDNITFSYGRKMCLKIQVLC